MVHRTRTQARSAQAGASPLCAVPQYPAARHSPCRCPTPLKYAPTESNVSSAIDRGIPASEIAGWCSDEIAIATTRRGNLITPTKSLR
jgi:hypothetical protein